MTMHGDARGERHGYVICSESRTGSTLLCRWLDSTGTLGHPREYFRQIDDALAIERDPASLAGVLARAMTPNGVYGIKLFTYHVDATMAARWLGRLPRPRFVHLERRDLLGQAISMARAWQTDQYLAEEKPSASPRYDARAIRRQLRHLSEADARWRVYFARNGLDVLWLTYEEMLLDPDAVVRRVASHVGIADPPAIRPELIGMRVQRDTVSEDWRARFVAEMGDLDRLDHPLGRPRIWARRLARTIGRRVRR